MLRSSSTVRPGCFASKNFFNRIISLPFLPLILSNFAYKISITMDYENKDYGENPVEDMWTDYDYQVNTGELPELFDDEAMDDFVANLDDWD